MTIQNVQKQLDAMLADIASSHTTPRLLLHSCCGPCSSYVLEYLAQYFSITLLFSNSNIAPQAEYAHRLQEQARLLEAMHLPNPVTLQEDSYDHATFLQVARGLEQEKEGGARCTACFRMRMQRAAQVAAQGGFDYFTTTLSVSPHKNAALLNAIGKELENAYHVPYLTADFKKREGYKRSVTLAKEYQLYRQSYCGCEFSKQEASAQAQNTEMDTTR